MIITRKSVLSGVVRSKVMPTVTIDRLKMLNTEMVQNVFPELSEDDREFIMTGITKEEWDTYMIDEDE